jgi:hypothetical protein
MNRLMVLAAASLFSLTVASAAMASAQQDKMKSCNAEAKDKKGDERKAFMKECLSAKKADEKSAKTAQQEKMKTCNADAKTKALKGAERKQFMSTCLKG